jgi:magnesium chelatase family protein
VARYIQRQQKFNAHLTKANIKNYCKLNKEDLNFLNNAVDKLGLSARAYDRILKTARTIADLSKSENINREHISEAIGYRNFDR